MPEGLDLNILVSNIVSEKRYSHCRLCLKNIQKQYVRFQDAVSLDPISGIFLPLYEILTKLLGKEICDDIPGIDAVCTDCVNIVLEIMKFFNKCEDSTNVLNRVFNNLSDTLNVEIDTPNKEQSLYVLVSEHDTQLILVDNEVNKKDFSCDTYFSNLDELKEHNDSLHGAFTCKRCFDTVDENELSLHESSSQVYICSDCPQSKCTEESLKQHQSKAHSVYVCKECGKCCKGLDKLQVHEKKHVTKNKCPKCGKTYTTKDFFLKHVKLCLDDLLDPHPMRSKIEKTYICNECGKGYSTPGGLRVHTRFEHGNAKPHVCKFCNKKFTAPSYLKTHMVKHTGEKNFKCNLCSGKFVSKEALLYHTRRHTGEKPYSCTMCDETFVNASARAEHIKFKHVGPTLMCEICSGKFVTPNFLRQHIKKHHDRTNKLFTGRNLIPPNVPAEQNRRVNVMD